MADQFQYVKLPDGSYGKFAANASDETIRGAIEKDFPDAFNAKPTAPVPAGLQGAPDPEYKPFASGANLRDIASGVGKVGAQDVALAGKAASALPVMGNLMDPQKIQDMENYSTSANKGELFGKTLGNIAQALPAIYGGGEFAGGVADEVIPGLALPTLAREAAPVLGKVAGSAARGVGNLAKLAALGYGAHKLRELF